MNDRSDGENGLGLAGFIVSLVGILSCGLLSPVGAVMSLVAMNRQPRGFAIAGLVIGILGSIWMAVLAIGAVLLGVGVVAGGIALLAASGGHFGVAADMVQITIAAESFKDRTGAAPTSLDELGLKPETITDPWGNQYVLEPTTADDYQLRCAGPDGQFETSDDIEWSVDLD